MKSWLGHQNEGIKYLLGAEITVVEKTLIGLLLLTLGISMVESLQGRDVGNAEQIRLAKLQAQQEMMAQRSVRQ